MTAVERRFRVRVATVNLVVLAAVAVGAWLWAERRVARALAPGAAVGAEHGTALTLAGAEVTARDASGLPAVWVRFNGPVDADAIAPYLALHAGGRRLATVVERRSPDGRSLLLRFRHAFGSGDVTVGLEAGAPALPDPSAVIAPAVRAAEVKVALQAEMGLLRLTASSPSDGDPMIEAIFTEIPAAEEAAPFVSVDPPVAFRASALSTWRWERGLGLSGPFEPGRVYTVTFGAGLPSQTGVSLRAAVTRQVQIPDRQSVVSLAANGRYLSPYGRLTVSARAVNAARVTARLSRVPANNAVFFGLREDDRLPYHYGWQPAAAAAGLDEELGSREYRLAGRRNEAEPLAIGLREIAPGVGAGVYLLTLRNEDGTGDQRIIVISDLGLALRAGAREVFVWAVSVGSGKPAAEAELTLWSVKNQALATARTADDGTARLTWTGDAEPFAVTARRGDDHTYLPLNAAHRVGFQDDGGDRPLSEESHEALLTTDRGVYRPGETVCVHALVRDRELRCPEPFPVVLRLRKPGGRVLVERGHTLDRYGAAAQPFVLPDGAPTGVYRVEAAIPGAAGAVLGAASFCVEDFAPPQLAVKLAGVEAEAAGRTHTLTVRGDYLFGRPASGLPAEVSVRFEAAPFAPKGWDGWTFGDASRAFDPVLKRYGSETLDADGTRTCEVVVDAAWRPPAALREHARGEVRDGAGRTVSDSSSGLVHLYPHYIGLRGGRGGGVAVAEAETFDVALVRPDGASAAGDAAGPLVADIVREQWQPVVENTGNGVLVYRTVCTRIAVTGGVAVAFTEGAGRFTVRFPEAGRYRVTVRDVEGILATSLQLTAAAPGMQWWAWGGVRPDAVELTWDKAGYAPGELARLQIKSPFPGTALVTVEGLAVLWRQTVVMTGTVEEVTIPVTAAFLPHARCAVSVVRPARAEEPWQAHRASGARGLPLAQPERQLDVACTVPNQMRPGGRLEARLTLRDTAGRPLAGRAAVAAVDEGVLRLTGFEQTDPLRWFLEARQSRVTGYDLFNQLLPEEPHGYVGGRSHTAGDGAEEGPALEGQLSPVRGRRFKPVALWSGVVDVAADGGAAVAFDVPEFAGTLRLLVLAYDQERMGACEARVMVRRPHVLAVGLPRFLAPGDRCRLGAEVFNESGAPAEVRISARSSGPAALVAAQTHAATTAAGGVAQGAWELRGGPGIGLAQVTVRVEAGGESFEETVELPVRPASGRVLHTVHGRLEAGERKRIAAPVTFAAGTLDLRLAVSGRQEVQLAGALEALLDYPYGCLEQTVSRALPLVNLPDLAGAVQPGRIGREEAATLVNSAVDRVLAMKTAEGLFSMWGQRGWSDGWEWGTLYAAQFLAEAARAGYAVPADELAATLDAVERTLNRATDDSDPAQGGWQAAMALKAQAAAVLTIAGRPPRGWLARLAEQAALLRRDAAAQVAGACAAAGDARTARAVLERLGVPGGETRDGVNSEARTLALTLAAWCELEPEHPFAVEIVRRLNGLRVRSGWSTTQENALALLALGRYARLTANRAREPFVARVKAAGTELACDSEAPLCWQGSRVGDAAAEIANEGPGPCFYSLTADGVPVETDGATVDVANGLRVGRAFFAQDGEPVDPGILQAGDALIVKLTLTSDAARSDVVIADLLPAGLEIESATIGNKDLAGWWPGVVEREESCWRWMRHRDVRDDRVVVFSGPLGADQERVFYYRARAVTPGTYIWPAVCAEGMYEPEARAASGRRMLTIE